MLRAMLSLQHDDPFVDLVLPLLGTSFVEIVAARERRRNSQCAAHLFHGALQFLWLDIVQGSRFAIFLFLHTGLLERPLVIAQYRASGGSRNQDRIAQYHYTDFLFSGQLPCRSYLHRSGIIACTARAIPRPLCLSTRTACVLAAARGSRCRTVLILFIYLFF